MSVVRAPPHYQFSSDLVMLATHHIQFLQALHEHGSTLSRPSPESLRRYRDLWLPLVHEHSQLSLIPPVDLAWLWHCHRLAPIRYASYCKTRYENIILEATPPFVALFGQDDEVFCLDHDDDSIHDMVSHTISLWSDRYPDESFYLVETNMSHEQNVVALNDTNNSGLLLDGFDLLSSTDRQKSFLWQVSAPNFSDQTFLEEGLVNYHKFLFLKKMNIDDMIIVPTYQIDLIWHTHILSSIAGYNQDCKAIIGVPMNHDDGFVDRSEGGPLDKAFAATREAWKELYGEEYRLEGAMYRGEPPKQFFNPAFVLESKRMNAYFTLPSSHGHRFNQFIGVQGASSTNPATDVTSSSDKIVDNATLVAEWTNPLGETRHGIPGFVRADVRSSNPKKPDYIFGRGSRGIGYYHVTTKQSYEILSKRITAQKQKVEARICQIDCCWCCASSHDPAVRLCLENEVQELGEYLAIVKARAKA
jgi:hypothetical protein